ncbi:MAG: OmpA family protein [Desulfovibrionaceae bacterium]
MADKAPPVCKKCDDTPCEEGLPGWLATFADMMSLLLCFFVLLLSFAKQDVQAFKTLMGSIQDAFGVQVKRKEAQYAAFSPSRFERKDVELSQENKQVLGLVLQLKALTTQDENLKKSAKIASDENGVIMRITTDELFDPGSATLKPGADAYIDHIISVLKEHNFDLVVRGHTDNQAVHSQIYPSNWELSSARAAAALRRIMERSDIQATRLKAVGFADTQPLVPNNTPQNQAINRRMEFYFHRPEVSTW